MSPRLPLQKDEDMNDSAPLKGSPVGGVPQERLNRFPSAPRRLLALATLLAGATSLAQPTGLPKIELERLTLNPSATGSLLLGTGELLAKGGFRLSLTGHYANRQLSLFEDGERQGSVVGHRLTGHLAGAYGITRWLEVSAQAPVLLMQRGDDLSAHGVGQPDGGLSLGTPTVGLRLGLLSQKDGGAPVDLALGVSAGLPVGSADALAREDGLRLTPSVMVGRDFGPVRAGVDAGVLLRPTTTFSEDANVRDEVGSELRLGAALSTTGEGLRGELDVISYLPFHREGHSVEALAGARLPLSRTLEAYALAGVGFGDAPGTPSFRGLVGVAFGSNPPRCVAGGKHTPQQCPGLDDDGDGVLNRNDECPREGGTVDAQGCPLKDADSDGVVDMNKDNDQDDDGIVDGSDQCPTEAGPAERQGCPLRDSDGDGLLEEQDRCPTVPGIPEMRGCPEKDSDGDTVSDHVDNCRNEPGPVSNQGCPTREPQQVVIKTGHIELKDAVYFHINKTTIQPRSFKLLDQVTKILLEHPELEKLWIEGHTDSTGTPAYNLKLSQQRAESVRDYFLNKGVALERLEARGFGQERPIADNKTVQGRAANRRTEFLTTPREPASREQARR